VKNPKEPKSSGTVYSRALSKLDPPPKGSCKFDGRHRVRLGVFEVCDGCGKTTEKPGGALKLLLLGVWLNLGVVVTAFLSFML
jgi:hypothetical protein